MLDANNLKECTKPIQADLDEFDGKLTDYLRGDSPLISSIARHLLKSKGKRIRPAFLFLSSRTGGDFTKHSVDSSLAIELIHAATLLHDDVVDESDMRRGQETVNVQWTNLISVLMGDYLFAKAFRILVGAESMELMNAVAGATERVSVGELRQIEETGNFSLSEEEYISIIADKTAALFSVCCEAGSILNRRSVRERNRFTKFGERIGTAFQIADDLLDFVGDPEVTGKELGNDVLTGKITLPLIYALKKAGKKGSREIIKHMESSNKEASFEKVFAFVSENGGIEYAHKKACKCGQQGLEAICQVGDSEYYQSLVNLVEFATQRNS